MVGVHVGEDLGVGGEGGRDVGAGPIGAAGPETLELVGAELGKEDIFEQHAVGPDAVIADCERRNALRLEGVGNGEELGPRRGGGQVVGRKDGLVEPEDVRAVDVERDAVVVRRPVGALGADDVENALGKLRGPVVGREQVVQVVHVARGHIRIEELMTHVDLERVRRRARKNAVLKSGLGNRAGAAGDGAVRDEERRVVAVELVDDGVEATRLATGGPPGDGFDRGRAGLHRADAAGSAAGRGGRVGRTGRSDDGRYGDHGEKPRRELHGLHLTTLNVPTDEARLSPDAMSSSPIGGSATPRQAWPPSA